MMADKQSPNCLPCSFRDIETESLFWCVECEEYLCSACQKYHLSSKRSKLHHIVTLEERQLLPDIVKKVRQTCYEHDRKFELYCSCHQEPCCIKCINNHKNCNVSPIEEIISDVKSSVAIDNIEEGLNALLLKIDVITQKTEEASEQFKIGATNIKKNISELRNQLEEVTRGVEENVDKSTLDYEKKKSDIIKKMTEKRSAIQSIKRQLSEIKENASNLQVFLCLKDLETMLSQQEGLLTATIDDGEFDLLDIRFEPSTKFKEVITTKEVGEIIIQKRSLDIGLGSLIQTAKLATQQKHRVIKNIADVKLEKKMEIDFPRAANDTLVTNCTILLNDIMLFADFSNNKRLILFDGNGRFLRNIETESNPFDITESEESVVVITLPNVKKVIFIELKSNDDEVVKSFNSIGECYGIDHSNNRLAVSIKGYGIQIFSVAGTEIKTIPFASTVVAFSNSNICYVDTGSKYLRCCDYDGKGLWEFSLPNTQFYKYPSLTTDEGGNIYVTESGSDDFFIVTPDGADYKKLLKRSDELYYVNGVCIDMKKQQLLLCTKRDKVAVLYNVSA